LDDEMVKTLTEYIKSSEAIDFDKPLVYNKAKEIASQSNNNIEITKKCFEFVRDEIYHCVDFDMNPVTYIASDVLLYKTGFCFAKSHLLVALLRANSIPAGLCYQRTIFNEYNQQYCLHGFVAVHLLEFGWYRIDPRGNKEGINSQFNPPYEYLAFKNSLPGEYIFPAIWKEPLYSVKELLTKYTDYKEAIKYLPDMEETDIINNKELLFT
jgi:transglutaminase-like putative cysteine protease